MVVGLEVGLEVDLVGMHFVVAGFVLFLVVCRIVVGMVMILFVVFMVDCVPVF